MKRIMYVFPVAFVLACGDDGGKSTTDTDGDTSSEVSPDTTTPDAGPEETLADTTPGETDTSEFTPPEPIRLALSESAPDQLQSAVAAPGGGFFAAGFIAAGLSSSDMREVVVVRLSATGLDTAFGTGGVVSTGVDFKGGSDEIDIAVDSQGRIVVSAVVASETHAGDTDLAVVRLTSAGALDTSFGDAGVAVIDLNDGIAGDSGVSGGDRVRGLALDASDRIYLHALRLADGEVDGAPRTDTDFAVVRLTADGELDASFADGGEHLLDLRGAAPASIPSNATPRGIVVLADGSVIAGGYATTDGLTTGPQAVLYKLDADGALDTTFGGIGYFHDVVLGVQTEVYGFAIHGTHLVTGGYGRDSGDQNDWVSLRFEIATGARDTAWGGAPNGAVVIDPSGQMVGDNCRNAIGLPGGKTALIGSTGPNNQPAQDAVIAVLDADGTLDASFGTGIHIFTFGDGDGGNDQLWGGAVAGDHALFVGHRGGGAAADQTADNNDDAYMVVLPLP